MRHRAPVPLHLVLHVGQVLLQVMRLHEHIVKPLHLGSFQNQPKTSLALQNQGKNHRFPCVSHLSRGVPLAGRLAQPPLPVVRLLLAIQLEQQARRCLGQHRKRLAIPPHLSKSPNDAIHLYDATIYYVE